jgi:alkylation response protein AidB-like acyl-CoA dehydrogenase
MATLIDEDLLFLKEKVSQFAGEHIAPRSDLYTCEGFPFDIWHKMAQENLLGLSIPKEFGGCEKSFLAVAVAGETMTGSGHNMGLALSWLIHQLTARLFIFGHGNKTQRDIYLPPMAKGKITASLAISEPDYGAHPRHLKTRAERKGDWFVLNGQKAYLTNGPIANLYIVLAVTGTEGERKRFTAFLVPEDAPGLVRTGPIKLPFLHPSPHGGIMLNNCTIPSANIIGREGSAYEDMSLRFRRYEDVLLMGPIVGGMEAQTTLLSKDITARKIPVTDETRDTLGTLQMFLDTLRIMAYEGANMLDIGNSKEELISLTLSFREICMIFQEKIAPLLPDASISKGTPLSFLTNDLVSMLHIAKDVAAIKRRKLGDSLLAKKERTHRKGLVS